MKVKLVVKSKEKQAKYVPEFLRFLPYMTAGFYLHSQYL